MTVEYLSSLPTHSSILSHPFFDGFLTKRTTVLKPKSPNAKHASLFKPVRMNTTEILLQRQPIKVNSFIFCIFTVAMLIHLEHKTNKQTYSYLCLPVPNCKIITCFWYFLDINVCINVMTSSWSRGKGGNIKLDEEGEELELRPTEPEEQHRTH